MQLRQRERDYAARSRVNRSQGTTRERPCIQRQTHQLLRRRTLLAALAVGAGAGRAAAQAPAQQDPWPSLAAQIFNDRAIQDGSDIVAIDAPYRAEDAALVPVELRCLLPEADARRITALTLVIDANPSPLAAVFTPGASSGMRSLSTRVRVDSYTNLHAVAELSDGRLYATQRFVKAAGGCSAPASKPEAGSVPLGTMRFRQFPPAPGADPDRSEAQLLIRHPNYSGMQMDQLTRLYVPAHFVKTVRLWQGQDLAARHRERHLDLRKPKLPLRLPPERRGHLQSRNGGQRGQVISAGVAGDADLMAAGSEAANLRLRLRLLEVADDRVGGRAAELRPEIAAGGAAHAQHRLGLLVFVVRQHRCDHVNRT